MELLSGLGADQVAKLRSFTAILAERAIPIGAVAAGDADVLWERHVLDSLRGIECLSGEPGSLADVGSGAGLPGLPLAIALPHTQVRLVEPRRRRAALLELAATELGLANVQVVQRTAETSGLVVQVCTARAVARPERAWEICQPLLAAGGGLLLWTGRSWEGTAPPGTVATVCSEPLSDREGAVVMMSRMGERPVEGGA